MHFSVSTTNFPTQKKLIINYNMKQTIIALIAWMATSLTALAYNVTGVVVDEDSQPMIKATVRVLTPADSTAVKGALTNEKGEFRITEISNGSYLLETSYVGYAPVYKDITVKGKNLALGTISMAEDAKMLRDVTVTGIKTPIKVMEDTVEFNADSYKTQPNAVVEDLLKRLPGVDVGSDGKITANGKEVKKILVDGKEFFTDDPSVASKNIPVDLVDKLQVVDRKSDLARLTGVDDGEEETVINLTVKKGKNNGWFGNVDAGYGTDEHYDLNFNVNRFWNGNQLTVLGGANNVNNPRFGDRGGNFTRFGGRGGLMTSRSLGVNFNVGNGEILRVGGDMMYSYNKTDNRTRSSKQTFFQDYNSFENTMRNTRDEINSLSGNFRIEWKPDSFNTVDFRPNFEVKSSDSEQFRVSSTMTGPMNSDTPDKNVNNSTSLQRSHGKSYSVGGRLIYNHNFKQHRGRSFSVFANYSMSNTREYANTFSKIFYELSGDSIYDQFDDNHSWNNSISSRVSWTEPLGDVRKGNFLTFSYQFSYRWNNADRITYMRPVSEQIADQLTQMTGNSDEVYNYMGSLPLFMLEPLDGDERVDSLSNRFRNDYMNQNFRIGYKHVSKSSSLEVGLSLVPQMSKSEDLINTNKNIPERWVWNYAPFLRYRYKMSKTRSINVNYRGNSSQPSISQLQPVADYSDPLNVVQGNPELDPSFTHNVRVRFQDFNMEAQRAIMLNASVSVSQNSIVSNSTFDRTTGARYTTYENVNGVWSANLMNMISFPLKNKEFKFNNFLMLSNNHNVGYSNGLLNKSNNFNFNIGPALTWNSDYVELELRPTYGLQISSNSVQTNSNRTVNSYGGTFRAQYYAPFGLVVGSDLTYRTNEGYGEGFDTNEWLLNASLSYQFLKDRSLTVSLKGYDLLDRRSNVSRTVTANSISDSLTNTLGRYAMVSVTWKFQSYAKGDAPDMNGGRGDFPGPPPGSGNGGRPMGPPPGGHPRF